MKSFRITLTLRGPLLARGTAFGAFGVDAVVARDGRGRLVLPGSHVLGKVREAIGQLDRAANTGRPWCADWETRWFAGVGDKDMGVRRRRIHFDDLVADDAGDEAGERTRVAIDPALGRALEGALQVYEAPLRAGKTVTFQGLMHVLADEAEAKKVALAVRAALNWTTQLGGLRTIGFGRVQTAKVEALSSDLKSKPLDTTQERYCLVLRFRTPFLVAARRAAANTYAGEDIVPGSTVKGALAAMAIEGHLSGEANAQNAPRYQALAGHLDKIAFSHLFPVPLSVDQEKELLTLGNGAPGGQLTLRRPVVSPRSLGVIPAALGTYRLPRDYALANSNAELEPVPAFSPDWKAADRELVRSMFPWPEVGREIRIRTAIDAEFRAAKAEQLFAMEMIRPDGHVWVGTIDLAQVPEGDRASVVAELSQLVANGIAGIGRGESSADAFLFPEPSAKSADLADDGWHVMVLQTPALLRAPDLEGKDPVATLRRAYAKSIEELLDGTVVLQRCFVRERLAGAEFMARRFFHDRPYRPWLLTEAGSTFVLKVKGDKDVKEKARTALETARRTRLGLSSLVRKAYGYGAVTTAELWRDSPYLPENGYGEILLDHPVHREFRAGTRAEAA